MRDCFTSQYCTVSFASGEAVVEWTLAAEFVGHGVAVYRSPDGVGSWQIVHPEGGLYYGGRCVDADSGVTEKLQQLTYRLDCEVPDSQGRDEDIVGSCLVTPLDYSVLSLGEIPLVRRMIMTEIIRLRRGAGVPCWVYAPLVSGTGDPEALASGLVTSFPCPAHDTKYGTFYEQGFSAPFQSWIQLRGQQNSKQTRQDGQGALERVVIPVRLPAFPYIREGYLIVLPGSDRRFAVSYDQTPLLYRGIVPVAFNAEVHELNRQDPRYRVPVPPFDKEQTTPAFFK